MDEPMLTPVEIIDLAKKSVEKMLAQRLKEPDIDYFRIPSSQIEQRLCSAPSEKVRRYVKDYNATHDQALSLLSDEIGIGGNGGTDRAIMAISYILEKINASGSGSSGITQQVINYAVSISENDQLDIQREMSDKVIVSFTAIDFAKIFYNTHRLSGKQVLCALDTLKKLNDTCYLLYDADTSSVKIRRYLTLPEMELHNGCKNLRLTVEIDPVIFTVSQEEKFAFIPITYFGVYLKANHFQQKFFLMLVDIARKCLSRKWRKKSVETLKTISKIYETCATEPKYAKNPQYKRRDLELAIQMAKKLGIINGCAQETTQAGEDALRFSLNLRYHLGGLNL